jgi:hypothetical protein
MPCSSFRVRTILVDHFVKCWVCRIELLTSWTTNWASHCWIVSCSIIYDEEKEGKCKNKATPSFQKASPRGAEGAQGACPGYCRPERHQTEILQYQRMWKSYTIIAQSLSEHQNWNWMAARGSICPSTWPSKQGKVQVSGSLWTRMDGFPAGRVKFYWTMVGYASS